MFFHWAPLYFLLISLMGGVALAAGGHPKDVVVIGAGPAGLWAAHQLAGLGFSVTALQSGADTAPARKRIIGLWPKTKKHLAMEGLELSPRGGITIGGIESLMRQDATKYRGVTLQYEASVSKIEDIGTRVRVYLQDDRTVEADYVVVATGAGGRSAKLSLENVGIHDICLPSSKASWAGFTIPAPEAIKRPNLVALLLGPKFGAVSDDDMLTVNMQVPAHLSPNDKKVQRLASQVVKRLGGDAKRDLDPADIDVYQNQLRRTDRFVGASGKVFVIGDRAHQFPPTGTGLNHAIEDVRDRLIPLFQTLQRTDNNSRAQDHAVTKFNQQMARAARNQYIGVLSRLSLSTAALGTTIGSRLALRVFSHPRTLRDFLRIRR